MRHKLQFLLVVLPLAVFGQGAFQNLNFEAANLPVIPSGQFGGQVSSLDALPSWTAYFGTNQTSLVLHNNLTVGAVSISVFGPNFGTSQILQGNYSVLLRSGLSGLDTPAGAVLAQTGNIPATALSIQFMARQLLGNLSSLLVVSVGGQNLPLVPLSITPNYTLYGANISAYSGLTRELRIGSLPLAGPEYGSFLIDGIAFSNQAVPEPSTLGLLGLGALLFSFRSSRAWSGR